MDQYRNKYHKFLTNCLISINNDIDLKIFMKIKVLKLSQKQKIDNRLISFY